MISAGVAAGIGLMLLIPTFNALNYSYVEDVPPPSWLKPPENPPTPPSNWQPPPDFEPPPDWEPPEGWEGKYDIPPMCPPPVRVDIEFDRNPEFELSGFGPTSYPLSFVAPNLTLGVGLWFNVSSWRGNDVRVEVVPDNESYEPWSDQAQGQTASLLGATTSNPTEQFVFNSDEHWRSQETQTPPAWGRYAVRASSSFASDIPIKIEGHMIVACGGLAP